MDFWYDFASPYCYLTAMRIDAAAEGAGVRVAWRPLLLGPILGRRWPGAPAFQQAPPAMARYRRTDVERHCRAYGLALRWPTTYPRGSLIAARVALVAGDEGWGEAFAKAVFSASFAADADIAAEGVVAGIVASLGRPAEETIGRASAPENKRRLSEQVEAAVEAGVFGVPSFVAGGELFWGNDRLEMALAHASGR